MSAVEVLSSFYVPEQRLSLLGGQIVSPILFDDGGPATPLWHGWVTDVLLAVEAKIPLTKNQSTGYHVHVGKGID